MLPFDVAFENSTKEKRAEHNEKSLLFLVLCVCFEKKWYSEDFTGTKRRFRTKQKHRRKVRKSKGEEKTI